MGLSNIGFEMSPWVPHVFRKRVLSCEVTLMLLLFMKVVIGISRSHCLGSWLCVVFQLIYSEELYVLVFCK